MAAAANQVEALSGHQQSHFPSLREAATEAWHIIERAVTEPLEHLVHPHGSAGHGIDPSCSNAHIAPGMKAGTGHAGGEKARRHAETGTAGHDAGAGGAVLLPQGSMKALEDIRDRTREYVEQIKHAIEEPQDTASETAGD